jgi:FMN-dependent oxidoreductase (nitrilotriacetate monooxygenase family)
MKKKKIHFGWFVGTYYGPTGWDAPYVSRGYDWREPEMYQEMASICEKGMFDIAIVADRLGICNVYQNSPDAYVKWGFDGVCHDSTVMAALIAAGTKHIGVATTISTSLTQPYMMARQTASLDHLSKGRAAFNVVTTATGPGYDVMGIDETFDQGDRYDRADEYMDLCFQLWSSWEPDAIVMDRKTGIFADPSKVHSLDFDGKYYKCRGPLNVAPCPQGRPAIIQAGTSERGREFAARWADAVIAGFGTEDEMKAFYDDVKGRAVKYGRKEDDLKILFSTLPVLGETEEIANIRSGMQSKWGHGPQLLEAQEDIEAGLAMLSYQWNLDLSQFALDEPLPELDLTENKNTQALPNLLKYYAQDPRPTVREMVQSQTIRRASIIGTPEYVADRLESMMENVGGDGFTLRVSPYNLGYMSDFVNMVIPILQERDLVRKEYTGSTLREHLLEY